MAVYRFPPQIQWHQHGPLDLPTTQSVDSNLQQPPQPVASYWRPTYCSQEQWQPRRLLDVSIITTVDAPIPTGPPEPSSDRWRPPAPTQPYLQPRDLLSVDFVQSVDSPTGQPAQDPWLRPPYATGVYQQPRHLLDTGVTQSTDSPTGAPTQDVVFARPAYPLEPWQPKRYVDTSVTQSVDAPPGNVTQPAFRRAVPFPLQRIPFDPELFSVVQVDNPPTANPAPISPYVRVPYPLQAWQGRRSLDTTVTQSVDSPPGNVVQPAFRRPPAFPQQLFEPCSDLFTVQASVQAPQQLVAPYLRTVTATTAYLRHVLDVSITQSVDSPPGFAGPLEVYDRKHGQWPQPGAGVALLGGPDQPGVPFPNLYLRDAPSRVPWQRRQRILFETVDSPSGPFIIHPAAYRRVRSAVLQRPSTVVTLIPLDIEVGPGVTRVYSLAAHTIVRTDGRRTYIQDARRTYRQDADRTYELGDGETYRWE